MGKRGGKGKKSPGDKAGGESNFRQVKAVENITKSYDEDTAVFILMSRELKDEGNRLFQMKDYEGAMLKYDKAISLLPRSHVDVSYLRSNMAACYMQLGITEYPRAIHECNLALEVTPNYSKALLKRARCYEALNRLDLALRDVGTVLKREPNNLMATEVAERVKQTIEKQGPLDVEIPVDLVPLPEEPPPQPPQSKAAKGKARKKKLNKVEENNRDDDMKEENKGEEEMKIEGEEVKANGEEAVMKIDDANVEKRSGKTEDGNKEKKTKTAKAEAANKGKKIGKTVDVNGERNSEDKLVVEEEKISNGHGEEPSRSVKLVFGEDIRWGKIPFACSIQKVREIVSDRFPGLKAVLVKYRDQEGDLITITTTEELRMAEASAENGSMKLYVVEVNPDQDPLFRKIKNDELEGNIDKKNSNENGHVGERKEVQSESACITDWIVQFAQLFKNYVGFDIDAYLDLHEVGMKLCSDAMEETVTSEEAQELFNAAGDKFQEMAALALFNWGNIHMSQAKKRVNFSDESPRESMASQIKSAHDWAKAEYIKAGERYSDALRIKPNFYEAVLALGQQQFELAKLSWNYAVGTDVEPELFPSTEIIELYNKAEENTEKGLQMWEDGEEKRVTDLSLPNKVEPILRDMKLDNLLNHITEDEAAEQAENIRSQIYILWGTMLYERSIMEFKLGLPVWQECLEVAVEKFELAGASQTDIAVMIKSHCSNDTTLEGYGFDIDEIVQAMNEMYDAKNWQKRIPSFRLEPLLRRKVSKLNFVVENA
ncbi:protein PHOX1-like [Andrographis paniculata]|uniref:protein PHOX1-like n=1 Tax=Andrographis paniculata TaxID=175694 RepID=UPI0021E79EC1|nr:protein PHOX1-like [Andrographis paniculata]